jgi:hypothetical protein
MVNPCQAHNGLWTAGLTIKHGCQIFDQQPRSLKGIVN